MAAQKLMCSCCGKAQNINQFYMSESPFNAATGKLTVCKSCLQTEFKKDKENLEHVQRIFRMIDRPFIYDLWLSSIEEANAKKNGEANTFGVYMKNIGMKDYRFKTWEDSEFPAPDEGSNITHSESVNEDKIWGNGFSKQDLEYLNNFYRSYAENYATDTPVQINLYRNIAKVHLQADKELANGAIKTYKDLLELSSKLHNDGNIKPIQSTGANDDKGLSSYGLWIKTIETTEPCEYFENKKEYEDYDKFKEYIQKWFVRPFKNIFNISKDFDVND
ncbi:hypothetical protein ACFUP3_19595 [Bacillus paralicheniformis]|uniref:hypothetical protein n=1 Tax=Bacillus paralicheniformis TaxID=1648923 RepID=UPI0036360D9F